jgi:hypothetical protein
MGGQNYYMVFKKKDKDDDKYFAIGLNSSDEEVFKADIHFGIYLN